MVRWGSVKDAQCGFIISFLIQNGSVYNDGGGDASGHVRIFDFINGSWIQVGKDIDGESLHDESGRPVSLSSDGTRIAIGAILNDGGGITVYGTGICRLM